MKSRRELPNIAQMDLLWNALLGFLILFLLVLVILKIKNNDKTEEKNIITEGMFAIVYSWLNDSGDDVDAYVMDPQGHFVYFRRREDGLMHLERDDRGKQNDQILADSKVVAVEKNEERVIIRGIIPGEYVVNVHMFLKRDPAPAIVKIELVNLRGADKTITTKEISLEQFGNEKTAFRFTLNSDGSVSNINELQYLFVGSAPDIERSYQ